MEQTDALTGLGHRRAFAELLEKRSGPFGVLLADLDRLSAVDAALGYRAGDEYLLLAAECLKELSAGGDTAYRIDGGRFALLLPDGSAAALELLAARLREAFAQRCPPRFSELGAGLTVAWAECAGDLKETVDRAKDALEQDESAR